MNELEQEIAALIIEALTLDIGVDAFDPEAPLYGDRFGLDSIDILEVALLVSKKYALQLRANSEENLGIFRSLRSLTEYIIAQRSS